MRLPGQLLKGLLAMFCMTSPAAISGGGHWVWRVQFKGVTWAVGHDTEHRLKLRHSLLTQAEIKSVRECIACEV